MSFEFVAFAFSIVFLAALCGTIFDDKPENKNTPSNNMAPRSYGGSVYSHSECPSCGASGYDGYCEECGYPDVNLGWIGENY